MRSHHHIRRQCWQVRAPDQAGAFALRTQLRRDLDRLNAVFERGLDAADSADELVHIPRLHLQLRIQDSTDLVEQLSLALAEQLTALRSADSTHTDTDRPKRIGKARGAAQLPDFLLSGMLQWYEQGSDAPTTSRQLSAEIEDWLGACPDAWQVLRQSAPAVLEAAVAFFLRLLNLLSAESRVRLLAEVQASLPAPAAAQTAAGGPQTVMHLFQKLEVLNPDAYTQRYLQALKLAALAPPAPPAPERLLSLIEHQLGARAIQPLQAASLLPVRSRSPDAAPASGHAPVPAPPPGGAHPNLDGLASPFAPSVPPPVIASLLAAEQEKAIALRVHMAGLVLLHPYLPRLFDACGVEVDAQGRIAPASMTHAAALLHRLATGREEIHEFELGMIKPLLGLSPDALLPVAPGLLTQSDAEEVAALLSAGISHWSVLRNTSADGLRISFLQRQGLLHDAGAHWQLRVESEAFDVLLAQLPWGISLVRLPWMTKPIFTDWPTR